MATFHWVYNASWDLVADGTREEPESNLIAAFNLNGICWQSTDGGKPASDDLTKRPLFPWKTAYPNKDNPGAEAVTVRAFADDGFALFTVDPATGRLDRITDQTALKRVPLPIKEDECGATMREIFDTQLSRHPDLDTLVQSDPGPSGAKEGVPDWSWSAILGGASMQGWPFAHLLDLAYWLRSTDIKTKTEANKELWCVVLPESIFGRTRDDVAEVKPAENEAGNLPVVVTYKAPGDGPSIRLRINAMKPVAKGTVALARPFVGFAQTIHAGTFTNWLGTLPHTASSFFDRVWLLRRRGLTNEQKQMVAEQHANVRTLLRKSGVGESAVPVSSVLAALSGQLGASDPGANLLLSDAAQAQLKEVKTALATCRAKIGGELVKPALESFRASVGMGLTRPFWSRAGAGTFTDSLAQTLFLAVNVRASDSTGTDDPRKSVDDLLGKASEAEFTEWARYLREALEDADSDAKGGSHSGHYTDVFELLRYLEGGSTPRFVEAELLSRKTEELLLERTKMRPLEDEEMLLGEKIGELFERHYVRGLEQLSRALEDEEVLRRLFCKQWDRVLKRDEHKPVVTALFGLEADASREPLYGNKLNVIADYMQEANLQFSKCLGEEVTSKVLPALDGVLEKQSGELIYKAMLWLSKNDGTAFEFETGDDAFLAFLKQCALLVKDAPLPAHAIDSSAVPSLRCQMLLAAALLGRLWFAWWLADKDPEGMLKTELAAMLCSGSRLPAKQDGKAATAPADERIYWRIKPWVHAVVGADRLRDFLGAPPPLPVPLIVPPADYDPRRHCGVLVLGKREDKVKKTSTGWHLLNVGEPVFLHGKATLGRKNNEQGTATADNGLLDEIDMGYLDAIGHRPKVGDRSLAIPAVQQPAEVFGVLQAIIEYRGQPLGVTKWDDVQDNRNSNFSPPGADGLREPDIPQRMERWQIVSRPENYNGWVAVPGLRYGTQFRYHFLFAPVQNTGALPVPLRDGSEPGAVWQRSKDGDLPKGSGDEATPHQITIVNYVRRVPVQQVRIAAPFQGGAAGRPYKDLALPFVPEGTKTLCADLETRERTSDLPAVRAPATTLLLRNKEQSREVSFLIRPPATSIENWSIWQASALDEAKDDDAKLNVQDCLSDMQRLAHELATSTTASTDKLLGLELTQLIDDPAVVGVLVQVSVALDLRGSLATAWPVRSSTILKFQAQDLSTYEVSQDPPWSDHRSLPQATRDRCRKRVQTHAAEELTISWADFKSDASLQGRTIKVPEGCVLEIRLIPCIEKAAHKDRFGIYEVDSASPEQLDHCDTEERKGDLISLSSLGMKDWYAVLPAMYRIWAESVPHLWDGKGVAPGQRGVEPAYLPNPLRMWKALQLGPVGTAAGEARLVQCLEVSLRPDISREANNSSLDSEVPDEKDPHRRRRQELCCWAFVSSVRAEIQPWSWRGLPEGETTTGGRDALSALAQVDFLEKAEMELNTSFLARDELQAVLMAQVRGEAPGFGEREDGASRVKDREINYATTCLRVLRQEINLHQVPVEIIDEGSNQQEEVPRYYQVRLLATSRYAPLGSIGPDKDSIVHHKHTAISAYDWEWNGEQVIPAEKRRSHHRRALMRGRLNLRPDPPRVKMVIPLLEPLHPNVKGARPGFIVVTRDTLRSPWHRFVGEIEWAKVNVGTGAGDEQLLESIEFAPDGITDPRAFEMAFKSRAVLRSKSRLEGQAFGLTYEREAGSPLFPNAGFFFAAPDMDITAGHEGHDWFAKVSFHWEIGPSCVMDNDAELLRGQQTQAWQVRLLAPFRQMSFGNVEAVAIDSQDVTFAEQKKGGAGEDPKLVFRSDGKNLAMPKPPGFGQHAAQQTGKSPDSLLLFITWSLVPDFLTAEHSKIAHSIYIFTGQEGSSRRVFQNEMAARSGLKPQGGNFVLLFGRHGDVTDVRNRLSEKTFGFKELVDHYLFPLPKSDDSNAIDQDAKLVITRCSAAIMAAAES